MEKTQETGVFAIPVRIYYEDTDAGGVVYYANYLKYLERCRTEWLRSMGFDQSELLREPGIAFVVRNVNIDYLKPAHLDNTLRVTLEVEKITKVQIFFRQRILRESADGDGSTEELICAASQIVCVNSASMKPVSIPAFIRAPLESHS